MTAQKLRYDTPVAFRAALKEHFGQVARGDGRYPLHELQRQLAYDRALARLFSADNADRWVPKGAGALLARLAKARHSKDIDVLFEVSDADVDDAVEALLAAVRTTWAITSGSRSHGSPRYSKRPRARASMSTRGSARRFTRPSTSM